MKIGILNKNDNKTVFTYIYHRYKTFSEYSTPNYVQYEIVDGTNENAYNWNPTTQEVEIDTEYVEPNIAVELIVKRRVTDAISFGRQLIIDFASENVLMGITQLGKTADVLAVITENVILPNETRPINLKDAIESGSLYEAIKLVDYHISKMNEYTDLDPFITTTRLTDFKSKIEAFLAS